MLDSNCQATISTTGKFELRRAVERLRDGLFDPLGIKLLTMGEAKLAKVFDRGAAAVEKGQAAHLSLCGAYGQGKSHSLNYIKQRAADQGFAVSYINLDPREVPFHQFKDVYRALMENIVLPGNNDLGASKPWAVIYGSSATYATTA
ncbi:MAG: BREX system ATP-binding domain-containing protein [Desulfobacteraceae bacterium]